MTQTNPETHAALNPPHHEALKPYDLSGLKTYDLSGPKPYHLTPRPSKVFHDDLGRPVTPTTTVEDWLDSLPRQLAAKQICRVSEPLCRARQEDRTVAAALGGHVIKTGCAPYLIDWIQKGVLKAVAMNGSA